MGGRAFASTRRSTKAEVLSTVEWLEENWKSASKDPTPLNQRLLGSAGKRETSGDIDLNINESIYDLTVVELELITLLGRENVWSRPGNYQIFTSVPVPGTRDRVQIDFMFGDYQWQSFSYASPSDIGVNASSYKGLFRTELIKALVAFQSDFVAEEYGEMVARSGPTFFHDRGIVWRYRLRPYKKDGSGVRIKALREVGELEFFDQFPDAVELSHTAMKDPGQVIKLILGDRAIMSDCYSYETIWLAAHRKYNENELKEIGEIFLERLNSLKVCIPKEINDEHRRTELIF